MLRGDNSPSLRTAAIVAVLAACLVAAFHAQSQLPHASQAYSVVPPLVAILLALITGRMLVSLAVAVLIGGWFHAAGNALGPLEVVSQGTAEAGRFLVDTIYDTRRPGLAIENVRSDNLLILLYVVLIMAMIAVMLAGGGLGGVARWLRRFARSSRSTQLVTAAAGLIVFIDDYANTMIVGATLRPVTDQQRISREKLAFLVDATAAPVAGIAVVSTWIGVEVALLSDVATSLGIPKDGYALFFDALGFRFYCLAMIAFVFLNAATGVDFGPMARAEERARQQGKLLDDGAKPLTSRSLVAAEPHRQVRIRAATALVPMIALLAIFLAGLWISGGGSAQLQSDGLAVFRLSAWSEVLSGVNSIPILAFASAMGLGIAAVVAVLFARLPVGALCRAMAVGASNARMPLMVLLLAWSLKNACDALETGNYLATSLGNTLPPLVFPALVFIVAAVTSFATGTSWGTMAILIPTAIPVAFQLDGGAYGLITMISIAAVLDGAIFGDHCSPLSDTTIMSSTASACDHLAHVRTQIPYSLTVAAVALLVGYVPAAFSVPRGLVFLIGIVGLGVLFAALRFFGRKRDVAG